MSASGASSSTTQTSGQQQPDNSRPVWRRFGPLALAVVLLVGIVVWLGPPAVGLPFDPGSAQESGLLGMVRTLEQVGVDVQISLEPPTEEVDDGQLRAFVPVDLLTPALREPWIEWVERGGTLVVAGPTGLHEQDLVEVPLREAFGPSTRSPGCDLSALEDVAESEHDEWVGIDPPPGAPSCFASSGGAPWLVAMERGEGTVIALGSATPFSNRWLADQDNAVLAAALLGPGPGAELTVVPRPDAQDRETTLFDLVPGGIWRALILLAVAIVVAVIARARRLGPPVTERLPDLLPSAELARSLAGLTERAGDHNGAAARLRESAWQRSTRSLGLARTSDPEVVIARLSRLTELAPEDLRRGLVPAEVRGDDDLLATAQSVAAILRALDRPSTAPAE